MSLELGTICLQIISILISLIAFFKGRKYMIGFLVGVGIYLYFNLEAYKGWHIAFITGQNRPMFMFIATVGIAFSVWESYRRY